jgi:methylmalonyl-CoA mutase
MVRQGNADPTWAVVLARSLDMLRSLLGASPVERRGDTWLAVDGRILHNTGATPAQELAYMLACGVSYLRVMDDQGIDAAEAHQRLLFRMSVDADYVGSLAKLRAFRRCWARVQTACEVEVKPVCLHAQTAFRMMAHQDVHTNLIRSTCAALSGIVGGADVLTVLPFTQAVRLPDAQARRLARNTALILRDEAHVAHVHDPVAGAGLWEAHTHDLCQKAWGLFQEIEEEGGLYRSIQSGSFPSRVALSRAHLIEQRRSQRLPMVGMDIFPPDNLERIDVSLISEEWIGETEKGFYTLRLPQFGPDQEGKSG